MVKTSWSVGELANGDGSLGFQVVSPLTTGIGYNIEVVNLFNRTADDMIICTALFVNTPPLAHQPIASFVCVAMQPPPLVAPTTTSTVRPPLPPRTVACTPLVR
jgi:hypothetical protein